MNTQPTALRLADKLDADQQGVDLGAEGMGWGPSVTARTQAADELRRLHQSEREGWRHADELEQERKRLHEVNQELVKAYRKMYNAAAGYSNYCEDSASVRRCERDFTEADKMFRAAIAKAQEQK